MEADEKVSWVLAFKRTMFGLENRRHLHTVLLVFIICLYTLDICTYGGPEDRIIFQLAVGTYERMFLPLRHRISVKTFINFTQKVVGQLLFTFIQRGILLGFCNTFLLFFIQHSFICRPSDSTVCWRMLGLEPGLLPLLAVRRSYHSDRSPSLLG
jgi:hypothetical protein